MQNLARDEAGNVWEIDAAGNPLRMVDSPAPAQGRVFSLPQSPKDARQEARDATADADRAADNARADKALGLQTQNAELERELKRLQIMQAAAKAGGGPSGIKKVQQLVNQINRVQELYDANIGQTTGAAGLLDYLPTNENARFDTAGAQLSQIGLAAFRTPGTGTVSDRDAIMFDKGNLPTAGTRDAAIEEILGGLRRRVEEEYQAAGQPLPEWGGIAQQRADNEVPDPTTGADLKPPPNDDSPPDLPPENGPQTTAASGDTRTTYDARMSAQIDALINSGASKGMIDTILKKQDYAPITPGEWTSVQQWRKQNPGKRYYGANISRVDDLSMMQRAAGSDAGAFLAHMGNTATAGIPAALAGPTGQGALDAMAASSPNAALVGGTLGGVTGAFGAEVAAARAAPAALAQYAPRIADTLYGGLLGFNTAQEGEGAQGAALGAGAGLFGGYLGEKAVRGVGAVTRGVRNPYVQTLRDKGVPLTVGETVGDSGRLGAMIRGAEDRMSGFWGVGDVIRDRRREGVEAFADRMANDAVAPIGGSTSGYGEPMVNDILQQGSDAYSRATAGANVPLDPQFATDMAQVRALGGILPEDLSQRFTKAIDNRVQPIEADTYLTGDSFQQAVRGLKSYRAEATRPGFEQDYRDSLSRGIDALRDQMTRGGGQGVVDELGKADQAWKQIKIVEKATNAARNGARSGEVGLPMPSHFNDAATAAAAKFGGPRFNGDLIDAGQRVLPNQAPDSGTAGRLGFGAMLAGGAGVGGGAGALGGDAQTGAASGLGLTLLLAAGGSKPAQAAMTKMLLDRPDVMARVGDAIRNNARIGGWTGAGTLTPLLVSP